MKSESEDPEVGVLTIEELEEIDSQRVSRATPEHLFWYECQRYILHLRVQVFEKTTKGEWRTIDGLKPFRVHCREDCTFPRLIVNVRRKYGMGNDVWKLTGKELGKERAACLFSSSGRRPRKIECTVLERTRALTKKQVRHLSALINREIRKNGVGVWEEDESVGKMKAELLFNGYLLECSGYREKDGKKICTFRAIDLDVWRHDGRRRDRMEMALRKFPLARSQKI